MAKLVTTLLLAAIFAGLILLAASAWRRRKQEQAVLFSAPAENFEMPTVTSGFAKVQYVATTIMGEPLNRVTAYGLGFRGRATITVSELGLLIERTGERSLAIAAQQVSGADFTQAVIGRAVEKDGLVAINWLQDQISLTTVLRFNSAADRNRILQASSVLSRKAI